MRVYDDGCVVWRLMMVVKMIDVWANHLRSIEPKMIAIARHDPLMSRPATAEALRASIYLVGRHARRRTPFAVALAIVIVVHCDAERYRQSGSGSGSGRRSQINSTRPPAVSSTHSPVWLGARTGQSVLNLPFLPSFPSVPSPHTRTPCSTPCVELPTSLQQHLHFDLVALSRQQSTPCASLTCSRRSSDFDVHTAIDSISLFAQHHGPFV